MARIARNRTQWARFGFGSICPQTFRIVRDRHELSAIVRHGICSSPGRGCSCRFPRATGAIRPAETAPGFARGGVNRYLCGERFRASERSRDGERSRDEPFDRVRRRAASPTSRDSDGADCGTARLSVTSLTVGAHLVRPVWGVARNSPVRGNAAVAPHCAALPLFSCQKAAAPACPACPELCRRELCRRELCRRELCRRGRREPCRRACPDPVDRRADIASVHYY